MGMSKERKQDRMECLCKAYLSIKGYGTARQIYEWIINNNFGMKEDLRYGQVMTYLKNNVYVKSRSGRSSLRNCYGYRKEGQKPRVYYIIK